MDSNNIYSEEAKRIVSNLREDQRLRLLFGRDTWNTIRIAEESLEGACFSDGPHGLRKESGSASLTAMAPSYPSVCYPSASALACSFNRDLLYSVGEALALEAKQFGVSVLLGPGINHKRSPLCGRNFEYFSEDPMLTGDLASNMVAGIQSRGVGACIKHLAANSQECGRLVSDSIVDRRALMELYLAQFEQVIRKTQPWAVMTSYNKLNGTYADENRWLMEEIVRKRWGFNGAFVSDWGAVSDSVASVKAGLSLEMPGGDNGTYQLLKEAMDQKELTSKDVFYSAVKTTELILRSNESKPESFDVHDHLLLAQRAAEESAVLLKNEEDMLPLQENDSIALIGMFAKQPRYQGGGSSKVNSIALDNIFEVFKTANVDFEYCDGYDLDNDKADKDLIRHACRMAKKKDKVVIVAGLPSSYESEGFDRKNIKLPASMSELIKKVARTNRNTIVVLQGGSPMHMPWISDVKSVLLMYLSGCQGGKAAYNLLFGNVNPSGKLAETFPLRTKENPSYQYFGEEPYVVEYRESIFSGYRYYDTAQKDVLFPFGHGLSYTTFQYTDLTARRIEDKDDWNHYEISVTVKNTGTRTGTEIVQIYIGHTDSKIPRAKKELRHFGRVTLEPKESKTLHFHIYSEDLHYYDTALDDWAVENGVYRIFAGASVQDIRLTTTIDVVGTDLPHSDMPDLYYKVEDGMFTVEKSSFERLLGHEVPEARKPRPFTKNTTFSELRRCLPGKIFYPLARIYLKNSKDPAFRNAFPYTPLRIATTGSLKKQQLDSVVDLLNLKPADAVRELLRLSKKSSDKEQ